MLCSNRKSSVKHITYRCLHRHVGGLHTGRSRCTTWSSPGLKWQRERVTTCFLVLSFPLVAYRGRQIPCSHARCLLAASPHVLSPIWWWTARSVSSWASWTLWAPDRISSPLMNMSYELEYFWIKNKKMCFHVRSTIKLSTRPLKTRHTKGAKLVTMCRHTKRNTTQTRVKNSKLYFSARSFSSGAKLSQQITTSSRR